MTSMTSLNSKYNAKRIQKNNLYGAKTSDQLLGTTTNMNDNNEHERNVDPVLWQTRISINRFTKSFRTGAICTNSHKQTPQMFGRVCFPKEPGKVPTVGIIFPCSFHLSASKKVETDIWEILTTVL